MTAQRRPNYKRCRSRIKQKAEAVIQIEDDDIIMGNLQQSQAEPVDYFDKAEPDSDEEVEFINELCVGDSDDEFCDDYQDEDMNMDKIFLYSRE